MTDITDGKGERFKSSVEFRPSQYGNGYWNITVTDTQTGDEKTDSFYEAREETPTKERLANAILAEHKAELTPPVETRFDVSGEEAAEVNDGDAEASGE